jgi:hypothetical protein
MFMHLSDMDERGHSLTALDMFKITLLASTVFVVSYTDNRIEGKKIFVARH